MERLEIHHKSYLVKWVRVPAQFQLKWSVYPLKRSVNVAIIRHTTAAGTSTGSGIEGSAAAGAGAGAGAGEQPFVDGAALQKERTSIQTVLQNKGVQMVVWIGRCEADRVTTGNLVLEKPDGETYGVLFDNTFSKSYSKTCLAFVIAEPVQADPDQPEPTVSGARPALLMVSSRSVSTATKQSQQSANKTLYPLSADHGTAFSGCLLKKRRKKNQGYARRFFSLDYATATLSYYKNAQSSALRGSIPLHLAAVSIDPSSNITIDSGAEVWELRSINQTEHQAWKESLTKAKSALSRAKRNSEKPINRVTRAQSISGWTLERVTGDLAGIRDSVRRLVQETGRNGTSEAGSGFSVASDGSSPLQMSQVHERCNAVQAGLDNIISNILTLQLNRQTDAESPRSSICDDDFHDIIDDEPSIHEVGPSPAEPGEVIVNDDESDLESDFGGLAIGTSDLLAKLVPPNLNPLPLSAPIRRRTLISDPVKPPPGLIEIAKKVGGPMPVHANEPLSALQKYCEQFEYADILNSVSSKASETGERILTVAAFAVSYLSSMRERKRSQRKPFNPLLGETYEMVRDDLQFRLLAEKVVHNPVTIAIHAQGPKWTVLHTPVSHQKFLGRSVKFSTDGPVHVYLHDTNEHFSYDIATTFLRVHFTDQYVEPEDTVVVMNHTTGQKASIKYSSKSTYFSGRSEDVRVTAYGPDGKELPARLEGKWTEKLELFPSSSSKNGSVIWQTRNDGPLDKGFHFTSFAASLNEFTSAENNRMAPTDSRHRPDQRLLEEGDVDQAEKIKLILEEKQRERRPLQTDYAPRWFVPVENAEGQKESTLYRLKTGKEAGYWEQRAAGTIKDCLEIFDYDDE